MSSSLRPSRDFCGLVELKEVILMKVWVFVMGTGAVSLLATTVYYRLERWFRRRRLRGALECLDVVHNTLAGLAKCKTNDSHKK